MEHVPCFAESNIMLRQGIILKSTGLKYYTLSLFDKHAGHIKARAFHGQPTLTRSALLSYTLHPLSNSLWWSLKNINVETLPLTLAQSNLSFIHALLELLYHSISSSDPYPFLFELIWEVLSQENVSQHAQLLIFVAILNQTGLYPEEAPLSYTFFHHLLSGEPRAILKEHLSNHNEQIIKTWLHRCLMQHPNKDRLKVTLANW